MEHYITLGTWYKLLYLHSYSKIKYFWLKLFPQSPVCMCTESVLHAFPVWFVFITDFMGNDKETKQK